MTFAKRKKYGQFLDHKLQLFQILMFGNHGLSENAKKTFR